jgi:predicted dehydrogenase
MLDGSREPFERAGCFDPDGAKAASFSSDFGYPVLDGEDAVLDASDALYVTTWTAEHKRLVEAAAARGIHVFCEKPLAVDADQAADMAATVDGAGVVNQVGLILRRSPAFGLLRCLLDDPAAGRPMAVVFRDDQHIPIRGQYGSTWRGDPDKAGHGTLIEHSIHDLDILEFLLGPAASVSCRTANFHGIDEIEDLAAATITFANGAAASLTSVWHDVDERPSLRHVEVFAERLYARLEGDWEGPVSFRFAGDAEETTLSH